MQINRRRVLNGIACGAAGTALGAAQTPAYFNFFGSPVCPDRYTRNMADLVVSRVVSEPSLRGGHSLEMEFRFSEKDRYGTLLWDLAPIHISRVRFHVFNPNPSGLKIILKTTLADTKRRQWLLDSDDRPLRSGRWTEIDAILDAHSIAGTVFMRMMLRLEVEHDFPAFNDPLLLYLDGVEFF